MDRVHARHHSLPHRFRLKTEMTCVVVVFGQGCTAVEFIRNGGVEASGLEDTVLYYELLRRTGGEECCLLFAFEYSPPAPYRSFWLVLTLCVLCFNRPTGGQYRSIWDWLHASVGFICLREVGSMTIMSGLRYLRMLLKQWCGSELYASIATEGLEVPGSCKVGCMWLQERARILRSVQAVGALHENVRLHEIGTAPAGSGSESVSPVLQAKGASNKVTVTVSTTRSLTEGVELKRLSEHDLWQTFGVSIDQVSVWARRDSTEFGEMHFDVQNDE